MNAAIPPPLPEVHLGHRLSDQPSLDLAGERVHRYVWRSAYGEMLIEVHDGVAFINGSRVTSVDEPRAE